MGKKIVITDEEQLRYITELFRKNYDNVELRAEDMDCVPDEASTVLWQPRSVTYSVVSSTPLQERVFVETIRCLQPHMSKNALDIITARERYNFFANVDFSRIPHFARRPTEREKFLEALQSLRFSFGWKQKAFRDSAGVMHEAVQYDYSGYIFIGHIRRNGSSVFGLHINPMALPYLVFVGKDMNYTKFDYEVFLKMPSVYSQRLYTKVCDWAGQDGRCFVTVEQMRQMLGLPPSYNVGQIKSRIIAPTCSVLESVGSSVRFKFQDVKKCLTGYKKSVVGYDFLLSNDSFREVASQASEKERFLAFHFSAIADAEKKTLASVAAREIVADGRADRLIQKFNYYIQEWNRKNIREVEFKNIMLKIVRENYGYDFRSDLHIRNSAKKNNQLVLSQ